MLTPMKVIKNFFLLNEDAYNYALGLVEGQNSAVLKDYYASQLDTASMTQSARVFVYASLEILNWTEIAEWLKDPAEKPLPKHVPIRKV